MKKFWAIYTQKNAGVLRIFETRTEVEDEARRLGREDAPTSSRHRNRYDGGIG